MSKETTDDNFSGRVQRAEKLVEHLITWMGSYYVHSGTMMYFGVVTMLALFGGVMAKCPQQWVPLTYPWRLGVSLFVLLILWGLLHIYIRSQLRNMRTAAIMQNAAIRALNEWVAQEPRDNDLIRNSSAEKNQYGWLWILDHLIPIFWCSWAPLHYDIKRMRCPEWLAEAIRQEEQDWKRINWGECLESFGSFIIFCIMVARAWTCSA